MSCLARFGADGHALNDAHRHGCFVVPLDGMLQWLDLRRIGGVVRVPGGELIDPHQGEQPENNQAEGDARIHEQTPSPQPART